jgi:hypothetical protein
MKIAKFLNLGIIAIALISFSSCKKEGCTDSAAANFKKDAKKDDGTCVYLKGNTASNLITVSAGEWLGSGNARYAAKASSLLTADVVNKGAVLCYLKDGDYFIPIPISTWEGSWTTHFFFEYKIGEITFITQDDDGVTMNPGNVTFKVVAIEANKLILNPDVDLRDYTAVKEAFDIKD